MSTKLIFNPISGLFDSVQNLQKVTENILPGTDNTHTLGSASLRWSSLSVGNMTLSGDSISDTGGLSIYGNVGVTIDSASFIDLLPSITDMNGTTLIYFLPTMTVSGTNRFISVSPTVTFDGFITTVTVLDSAGTYENIAAVGATWTMFSGNPRVFSQTSAIPPASGPTIFSAIGEFASAGTVNVGAIGTLTGYSYTSRVDAEDTSTMGVTNMNAFTAAPTFAKSAGATLTVTTARGLLLSNPGLSGTPTITNYVGVDIVDLTRGTNIFGIRSVMNSAASKYFLRATGTAQSTHRGNFILDGDNIYMGLGGASTSGGTPDVTMQYDGTNFLVNPQATGTGNFRLTAGAFDFGTTGGRISAATGVFTLASFGNTNNEDLTINLEGTANRVDFGTTSGVTELFINLAKLRTNSELEIDGALNHDGTTVGFYGKTPVTIGAALTTQLTSITHTAAGTPDFAIQDLTNVAPFGFATKDEGNTVLAVILNLQSRVAELEARLGSATGVGLFT